MSNTTTASIVLRLAVSLKFKRQNLLIIKLKIFLFKGFKKFQFSGNARRHIFVRNISIVTLNTEITQPALAHFTLTKLMQIKF